VSESIIQTKNIANCYKIIQNFAKQYGRGILPTQVSEWEGKWNSSGYNYQELFTEQINPEAHIDYKNTGAKIYWWNIGLFWKMISNLYFTEIVYFKTIFFCIAIIYQIIIFVFKHSVIYATVWWTFSNFG
jgi:hypothetical protein